MKTVNELIKDINSLTSHLHEKDFLLTWEQTPDELKQVLDVAAALKALRAENISTKVFNSGLGISVFRDNSTRTRFSYASALNLLGLAQQDLDEGKSQIAHGETVRENRQYDLLLRRRYWYSRRYVSGRRQRLYA